MAYQGNRPAEAYSSFQKQDFTTSATTSYTLDHKVANENELALFINFVRQEAGTAYTASNNTLTLSSATSASDDMYCIYLGKAVQTVNPPSGSVGSSQVSADLITGQTALGATPADTDELLISDAGTLKRVDYSYLKVANTPMFSARLGSNSSSISQNTTTKVVCGTEEFDTDSAYDTSNGRFTVPSGEGGKYVFVSQVAFNTTSSNQGFEVRHYKNGSGVSSNQVYADSSSTFSGSILTSLQNTIVIDLSASDYVETYAVAFNGGDFVFDATNSMTFFRGYKLIG